MNWHYGNEGKRSTLDIVGRALLVVALLLFVGVGTAHASTPDGYTVISKGGDESLASSVILQNDDDLFFTADSGVMYEIELVVIYASPAGAAVPDIKFGFGEDATARGALQGNGVSTADAGATQNTLTNQAANVVNGTAAVNRVIIFRGSHAGAGGVFRLLWAQNTSGINATVVRAGSELRYRPVGTNAGDVAWSTVTSPPNFTALYCDADGSEADTDCASGGGGDLSDYYTISEVDGIAALASDTCGGPSLPPCDVALVEADHESLNLVWWGVWALVGLMFILIVAPRWFAAFRVTHGA